MADNSVRTAHDTITVCDLVASKLSEMETEWLRLVQEAEAAARAASTNNKLLKQARAT